MAQGALPGFRDFYPEQFAERAYVMNRWREVARRYAFVEYDGPVLEPLELYTNKSGDEIVGQLYNFVDKGDRAVALRPEMTPSVARMVGAKLNALRKPVRWFSIPQLFRYERQQRGRLREHFQLNVDIFGEADVTADAELLAVAIDVMRAFGLTAAHVQAHVSDRRLLKAILSSIGVTDQQSGAVFAVIDKFDRQPAAISQEKLKAAGLDDSATAHVMGLSTIDSLEGLRRLYGSDAVIERVAEMERYFTYLDRLGVGDFARLDLSIVRGLDYYTGIVFELFDVRKELRAICGGGRYDNLLGAVGGTDLPAVGFGMGDVVLTELLRDLAMLDVPTARPDFWVATDHEDGIADVMEVSAALRRAGASAEYALRKQQISKQKKAAVSADASHFVVLEEGYNRSGVIRIDALAGASTPAGGDRTGSRLMNELANRPQTLESLIAVLHERPIFSIDSITPDQIPPSWPTIKATTRS